MDEPTSLSELVYMALRRHQTTAVTRLARIASDNGYRIQHSMLSRIRLNGYNHQLQAPAIKALAFLSGVPVSTVNELAGRGPELGAVARQLPDMIDILRAPAREGYIKIGKVLADLELENRDLRAEIAMLRGETDQKESGTSVVTESGLLFDRPDPEEGESEQPG